MPILSMLRVRNEARWIADVISPLLKICEPKHIFVLDDFSDDGTPEILESLGVSLYRSSVPWIEAGGRMVSDESAGKNFLLQKAMAVIPSNAIGPASEWLGLSVDGDEIIRNPGSLETFVIEFHLQQSFSLRILYLWNSIDKVRIDGVYSHFFRPSVFRMVSQNLQYMRTPFGNGCNFHCSSIPQQLLHSSMICPYGDILHLGYLHKEDRIRKYYWYNERDPGNPAEDGYRHMVIGDILPHDTVARWGGPLNLISLDMV